jgi:hypothetical protein
MMIGVQRSPNTSAALATGQNWPYLLMAHHPMMTQHPASSSPRQVRITYL